MMVDNLGPGAFPMLLGIILALCSIYLIVRPDPDPEWPNAIAWGRMALIILSFVVYAYIMEPLGFIITTTFEMIALGYIFILGKTSDLRFLIYDVREQFIHRKSKIKNRKSK